MDLRDSKRETREGGGRKVRVGKRERQRGEKGREVEGKREGRKKKGRRDDATDELLDPNR